MATAHRVGGEVDAFCTKCRLTLAHTILAMVGTKIARVRCNTCGGEHAMRSAPGSKPAATPRARAASADKPAKVVIAFEQRLAELDLASAKPYSPKETYAVNQLIQHPTFGIGVVTAVRVDKIDVDFKAAQKTLVHGRGGGAPQQPTFTHPEARNVGPSDKLPSAQPDVSAAPGESGESAAGGEPGAGEGAEEFVESGDDSGETAEPAE